MVTDGHCSDVVGEVSRMIGVSVVNQRQFLTENSHSTIWKTTF